MSRSGRNPERAHTRGVRNLQRPCSGTLMSLGRDGFEGREQLQNGRLPGPIFAQQYRPLRRSTMAVGEIQDLLFGKAADVLEFEREEMGIRCSVGPEMNDSKFRTRIFFSCSRASWIKCSKRVENGFRFILHEPFEVLALGDDGDAVVGDGEAAGEVGARGSSRSRSRGGPSRPCR